MNSNSTKRKTIDRKRAAAGVLTVAAIGSVLMGTTADAAGSANRFHLRRSPGVVAAGCLPHASALVSIRNRGPVETMDVWAKGLPRRTDFDVFVIQTPNLPFGVSWYQGDLESNRRGRAHGHYVGRFDEETFAVAPGTAPAPKVHDGAIPDAESNPAMGPVHTFHVGVWFNSPKDAVKAGCPGATTPFNGEHDAGVQVLNTGQFADTAGPIGRLTP